MGALTEDERTAKLLGAADRVRGLIEEEAAQEKAWEDIGRQTTELQAKADKLSKDLRDAKNALIGLIMTY